MSLEGLAAIPALFIFIIGVWFAIPGEAALGSMILDAFDEALCDNEQDNVACDQMILYKIMFKILGIAMIVGDIAYIYAQFKEGNII